MTKTLAFLGVLATILGLIWVGVLTPNHNSCSDALTASANYSACQGVDVRYLIAWALFGFGVLSVLGAVIGGLRRD